jgi:hypothetical protein
MMAVETGALECHALSLASFTNVHSLLDMVAWSGQCQNADGSKKISTVVTDTGTVY